MSLKTKSLKLLFLTTGWCRKGFSRHPWECGNTAVLGKDVQTLPKNIVCRFLLPPKQELSFILFFVKSRWPMGEIEVGRKEVPKMTPIWKCIDAGAVISPQFKTTTTLNKVAETHETNSNLTISRGKKSKFILKNSCNFHFIRLSNTISVRFEMERNYLKWFKMVRKKVWVRDWQTWRDWAFKVRRKVKKDYFPNWKRNQTILPANESWRTSTAVFSALGRKWKLLYRMALHDFLVR